MTRLTKYYKILGVDTSATQEEIEQAYNEKIALMQSDMETFGKNAYAIEKATNELDELIEAYKYISNSFHIRETAHVSSLQTCEPRSGATDEMRTVNQQAEQNQKDG